MSVRVISNIGNTAFPNLGTFPNLEMTRTDVLHDKIDIILSPVVRKEINKHTVILAI
jgi:hypothetical protein